MAPRPRPAILIGVGSAIVGSVVLGLVVGLLLDRAAHTSPVFTLVGLAVGIVGAVWYSYSQFHKFL